MTLNLTGWSFQSVYLPYPEPVHWVNTVEPGLDVLLLKLETAEGLVGLGEAEVRNWSTKMTPSSLSALLNAEVLPKLRGLDLEDEIAAQAALAAFRDRPLVNSIVDMAIWDLKAQVAGVPLWRALGGRNPTQPLSTLVTRAEPEVMAESAAKLVESYGFKALKIKTHQGLEIDNRALGAIRRAVGDDVRFFVDFNFTLDPALASEAAAMLVDHHVQIVEDPIELPADEGFAEIAATFPMPILVDTACRQLPDAERFLKAGAKAISGKMTKAGLTAGLAMGAAAEAAGAMMCVGTSAASTLGAIAGVSLASALPEATNGIPCEDSFFLGLTNDIAKERLQVVDGCLTLPNAGALSELVDWKKVQQFATALS